MSLAPPPVDAVGDFHPHYQEGLTLPIRDFDVNGVQIDLSARVLKFKTATLTKALVANPDDVKGLLLILTKEEVQAIPAEGQDFVIVDETSDPDDVRHEGRIRPRGWV